eukprot:5839829-Pleurochrysis_carterae.AAC.1
MSSVVRLYSLVSLLGLSDRSQSRLESLRRRAHCLDPVRSDWRRHHERSAKSTQTCYNINKAIYSPSTQPHTANKIG